MRFTTIDLAALAAALALVVAGASPAAALDVFACEPKWGALTQELGGSDVSVYTATTARQDPHQVQARPALIARLRRADLVVCTGGEPLLQLDDAAVASLHAAGFEIAIETNGTQPAPAGIDWICVSPKSTAPLVLTSGHELKLVFPQEDAPPERHGGKNGVFIY